MGRTELGARPRVQQRVFIFRALPWVVVPVLRSEEWPQWLKSLLEGCLSVDPRRIQTHFLPLPIGLHVAFFSSLAPFKRRRRPISFSRCWISLSFFIDFWWK